MAEVVQGTLRVQKNKNKVNLFVVVPSKTGKEANLAIPQAAQYFRTSDAEDGMAVWVTRDKGAIVKATLDGKPEFEPTATEPQRGKAPGRGQGRRRDDRPVWRAR